MNKNIKYAIMGSDTNPMYLEFWPVVSKIWKEIFGIIPVLGLICNEDSELYEDEFGLVKKFKNIDGMNSGLQSQIVRFYLPKYLDGVCLISDIDMLPLSPIYFETNSQTQTEDNIILYSSDNPECLRDKQYPMCYFSAHSKLFPKVFDINLEWEEFCKHLLIRNEGWFTDQRYLYDKVNEYNDKTKNVIFLNRGWNPMAIDRIDRISWRYDEDKVKNHGYIDSHSLRPYSRYKNTIDELIKLITS
jgi:hypothetical protein